MVFSSIEFIFFFLPVVLLLYYIVPFKTELFGHIFRPKNTILLLASLVFYSWGDPRCLILMLASSLIGWIGALLVCAAKTKKLKKAVITLSVTANLAILGYYKYSFFLVEQLNNFLGLDIHFDAPALPIGISFFTFQIMSYTIDYYRGEAKLQKNFFTFLTYVSMFPQLIAGPIVRYTDVCESLEERSINYEGYAGGLNIFLFGLYKKVLIANCIGSLWESIRTAGELSFASAWLGALAYTLQIYFDFSGYADMAVGMGKMLGFDFGRNFNYPYSAISITDFWRRWHISLSTWFRDYVYIPLGGNRCSPARNMFNLFAVWALTGLWHGAAYNYIAWGLYFFVFLVLEKFIWGKLIDRLPRILRHIYVIIIVMVSFIIFVFEDISELVSYLKMMFHPQALADSAFIEYIACNWVLIAAAAVISFPVYEKLHAAFSDKLKKPVFGIAAAICHVLLFILCCAYIISDSYNPFLYFRF